MHTIYSKFYQCNSWLSLRFKTWIGIKPSPFPYREWKQMSSYVLISKLEYSHYQFQVNQRGALSDIQRFILLLLEESGGEKYKYFSVRCLHYYSAKFQKNQFTVLSITQ